MKLAIAFLALQTATVLAASDNKPNPADFTARVQVIASGLQTDCVSGLCYVSQLLEATIDDEPVELEGQGVHNQAVGLLAKGGYPARISASIHGPKNSKSYDIYRGYDLLMPDGTVRMYTVVRLGPALPHP